MYVHSFDIYQINEERLKWEEKELIRYSKQVLKIPHYELFIDIGLLHKDITKSQYYKMMTQIRNKEFSHLIIWSLDEIIKDTKDFVTLTKELDKLGVTFISMQDRLDSSNTIGKTILKAIPILTELENIPSKDTKTIPGSGEWNRGNTPLGYKYDRDTKTFLTHPAYAHLIQLIYNLYERYQSVKSIAEYLNGRNH